MRRRRGVRTTDSWSCGTRRINSYLNALKLVRKKTGMKGTPTLRHGEIHCRDTIAQNMQHDSLCNHVE